jgi:hypothetical protein
MLLQALRTAFPEHVPPETEIPLELQLALVKCPSKYFNTTEHREILQNLAADFPSIVTLQLEKQQVVFVLFKPDTKAARTRFFDHTHNIDKALKKAKAEEHASTKKEKEKEKEETAAAHKARTPICDWSRKKLIYFADKRDFLRSFECEMIASYSLHSSSTSGARSQVRIPGVRSFYKTPILGSEIQASCGNSSGSDDEETIKQAINAIRKEKPSFNWADCGSLIITR